MANKYMKRCSTSSVIRTMQFKTIRGYSYIPMRVFKIKKTDNMSVGRDAEQLELSYPACVSENGASALNNCLAVS